MRIRAALATLTALLLMAAPAMASLASEQRQGQALAAQVRAGTRTCSSLSAEDLDHIGEYAMFRALGSTSLHQAMNRRMTLMLGSEGESRMHQLLGERYAGCSRSGPPSGGMMGGYGAAGWSSMMGAGGWGWMMDGSWRNMSRHDWAQLEQRMLGAAPSTGEDGWTPLAIVAVTLGGVLVVLAAVFLATRRRLGRPPAGTGA